jgi:hypothetical protein
VRVGLARPAVLPTGLIVPCVFTGVKYFFQLKMLSLSS